jgi:hypothetical protein
MAAPVITSVTPNTGSTSGGTTIVIAGSGFTGATAVTFGAVPATGVVIAGDTLITAISPAGSGSVNVTVTTPQGGSSIGPASTFTFSAPAPAPAPAPSPAPAPAGSSGSSGVFVDPGLSAQLVQSLLTSLQTATSPDALEAQGILLRRAALEGDLIGSRVPPPRNITEIGGYLNLLATLKETTMRQQALAGILGVAGPSQPLGWISNYQPLAMVNLTNDRPLGPAQAAIPLTVQVRSDFLAGVQAALKAIHQLGAFLPFSGPTIITLPPAAPGAGPPADILFFCGRVLNLAAAAALANPLTDPLVLERAPGAVGPYSIAANVLAAASTAVPAAAYDALQATATTSTVVPLASQALVPIAPVLAAAGYYPASPLPTPATATQTAWTRLQNTTGLVAGTTKLGDELALLYRPDAIVNSVFASMQSWTWTGTAFAP